MPSVITTHSPLSAWIPVITASLANVGGTKTTDTSAAVSFIASSTPPKTVRSRPPIVTVVPALRAFTPPTMFVPAASILVECLVPSEPVMPCTMTLLCSFRKIAISRPRCSELGGLVGRVVHRVHLRDQRVVGLVEDPPTLQHVVAVQPHDQRLRGPVTEDLERLDDAVRDRVTGGDAAEDVDEHALDVRVAEDHVQPGGHARGRGAAADVEDVGGLHAAVLLPGVGDD